MMTTSKCTSLRRVDYYSESTYHTKGAFKKKKKTSETFKKFPKVKICISDFYKNTFVLYTKPNKKRHKKTTLKIQLSMLYFFCRPKIIILDVKVLLFLHTNFLQHGVLQLLSILII